VVVSGLGAESGEKDDSFTGVNGDFAYTLWRGITNVLWYRHLKVGV
jgi:hypothetical protein